MRRNVRSHLDFKFPTIFSKAMNGVHPHPSKGRYGTSAPLQKNATFLKIPWTNYVTLLCCLALSGHVRSYPLTAPSSEVQLVPSSVLLLCLTCLPTFSCSILNQDYLSCIFLPAWAVIPLRVGTVSYTSPYFAHLTWCLK